MACCFFFSSRRRHTRSKRDWSSDVCSSDLQPVDICQRPADDSGGDARPGMVRVPNIVGRSEAEAARLLTAVGLKMGGHTEVRSEERRVGKECRSGGVADQAQDKAELPSLGV